LISGELDRVFIGKPSKKLEKVFVFSGINKKIIEGCKHQVKVTIYEICARHSATALMQAIILLLGNNFM